MELQPVQIGSPHLKAAIRDYNSIPSSSRLNFFKKCCLIRTQSLSTIRETFQKQTQALNKDENVECVELFKKWSVGDNDIKSVKTPPLYQEEPPNIANEDDLDDICWCTQGQ
jgi:hypothetical protein